MNQFYTTHEAAGLLGVSLPTVVNWIKARRLKAHRTPGGHRRIAREDLAGFMLRQGIPLPPELAGAVADRRKVLVIGALGPAREGLSRQLASAGYDVEQASPGFAAGAAAARYRPDAVVVSAGEDGAAEVLADLRADRELAEAKLVGVCHAALTEALARAGCHAVLARPLGTGALEETLAAVLGATPRPGGAAGRARRR
ncbi:MAG TPA: helix-turn-helix domain-containing protein [Anaeromyxobacteraceae bacterium]|jgi:excisionase family DNA binding protein|nr:helix-turn-helix domain-containing protein [Anaeromyxobacteraceae bacterium]